MVAQPTKQQKTTRAPRSRRGNSSESRDEENLAEVRTTPRTWSPKLELDGVAIPYNASVREYNRDRAGYVADALEQPLLLPRDMEAYRRFSQPEIFLSFKRNLAMVNNSFTVLLVCLTLLKFLNQSCFVRRLLSRYLWLRNFVVIIAAGLRLRPSFGRRWRKPWVPSSTTTLNSRRSSRSQSNGAKVQRLV